MKVALVHDWLNHKVGGAEQVLFELARMYPKADVFTLVYNKKKFDHYLEGRNIVTTRLQHRPGFMKNRPMLLLGGIKKSVEAWDFSGYDVVISSSTAWVKNITVPKGTRHICYCHSPARMLWDSWPKYLGTLRLGPFHMGPVSRFLITKKVSKLRLWDYYGSEGVDQFVANSSYITNRIQKYYHRDSKVVYPPVDTEKFRPGTETKKGDYYLCLSVLAKYKQLDIAVGAFKRLPHKLVIAGDGPDEDRLKQLAGSAGNITFKGRVSDKEKLELMQRARGFVFCNVEDFGITVAEAVAAQTGVMALRGGGVGEILEEGKTGWYFEKPKASDLVKTVARYDKGVKNQKSQDFDYVYKRFNQKVFREKIRELVGS